MAAAGVMKGREVKTREEHFERRQRRTGKVRKNGDNGLEQTVTTKVRKGGVIKGEKLAHTMNIWM